MNYPIEEAPQADVRELNPAVVLCGSFHRDPKALSEARRRLIEAGASVLSPLDLRFVSEKDGFVFAAHETGQLPSAIEENHLKAMRKADFIWLHTPDGYVGRSAAMELGFAYGQGLAVYAASPPDDPALAELVRIVSGPEDAVAACTPVQLADTAPTSGLKALQAYYARAAQLRGWDEETSSETLRLLTAEVEELAVALAKTHEMTVPVADEDPELELADVALYLVHLSNILNVDLAAAISAKERINAQRFQPASRLAA